MMQRDTLAEVEGAVVECLPVQAQLQVMLQIYTLIRTRSNTPESTPQLSVMYPDLDVWPIKELVQSTRMIQVQMPDDDLLDILYLISCCLNLSPQLMAWLVTNSGEDIGEGGSPDFGVVFTAACLPENEALVWMLDEDTIAGKLAAFVDERFVLSGLGGGVASTDNEGFVTFQPSNLEDMELRARRADVGDMVRYRSTVELGLNSCHCEILLVDCK